MARENLHEQRLDAFVLLVTANAKLTRALSRELEEECGVPLTWFEVLIRLAQAPDRHLRLTDLAGSLMLSSSGTTRLVDRIEAAGLIRRVSCPGDRRVVHATLTDDGEELLARARPVHRRGIERHFAGLPAGQLDGLVRALRTLAGPDADDAAACGDLDDDADPTARPTPVRRGRRARVRASGVASARSA